jgi:hypothetical protein
MYQTTLIVFVVVVSSVLVSPLVVVVRILLPARIQAMQEYDSMACELARVMRQKSLEAETSLKSVDTYSLISAHTDSRQGLETVGHTKPFMLTRNYVLWFVLATGIPIAVAALTRLPIEQIVRQLLKLATT